jgi:hypothetical protein
MTRTPATLEAVGKAWIVVPQGPLGRVPAHNVINRRALVHDAGIDTAVVVGVVRAQPGKDGIDGPAAVTAPSGVEE